MKTTKQIILIISLCVSIAFFFYSCSHHTPDIEAVLKQAGKNRKELEKVLQHYSRNPSDSLKLRAAEFLILNMPGKYSEYYDAPWSDVATVSLRWTSSPDKQRVLDAYGLGKPIRKDDLTHITAKYLISNIELAFKVWQERPWGKHISFEAFCEEILPYRLYTEPLENWREKALASFAGLEAALNTPDMTAVEACQLVNEALPKFRIDKDFPSMNFSQLMASTRGSCIEMSALAVFSMRALGIPVTAEYYPRGLESRTGHGWNCVRDSSNKHISFMGTERAPNRFSLPAIPIKVFRNTYGLQDHIKTSDKNIPPLLKTNGNVVDVSEQYIVCSDISVQLKYLPVVPTNYVYLSYEDENQWHPIAWAIDSGQPITFSSMKRSILYLPVYYASYQLTVAGDAFWLDKNGSMVHFVSDFQNTSDTVLVLHEVAPSRNLSSSFLLYGVFEGANKPDFSDAKVLYTINKLPDPFYNEIILNKPANYRYFRYKSPKDSRCHMAEIVFYDTQNEKQTGTSIGTPGAWNDSDQTHDKTFDNDITTYYEAAETNGSWTGLDLNERKSIHKIHYLPSTSGDNIYTGHEYKLLYWTKNGWQSLGIQKATGGFLQYQVPKHALFYLVNVTLARKGRVFFITSDNKIQWHVH